MSRLYRGFYQGIEFYHTFHLSEARRSLELWNHSADGNDITVYGQWNHNPVVPEILQQLPFTGKQVLDVGCRDGFYSFLLEKQGNQVTGLDIEDRGARRFVHTFLNSKAEFVNDNVYNIANWKDDRRWDVVVMADLLVHLENPLGALRLLHTRLRESIYVIFDSFAHDAPYAFVNTVATPWMFTPAAMCQLLTLAGFKDPRLTGHLSIPRGADMYGNPVQRSVAVVAAQVVPGYKVPLDYSLYKCASVEESWLGANDPPPRKLKRGRRKRK